MAGKLLAEGPVLARCVHTVPVHSRVSAKLFPPKRTVTPLVESYAMAAPARGVIETLSQPVSWAESGEEPASAMTMAVGNGAWHGRRPRRVELSRGMSPSYIPKGLRW